jgi:hypothetical protein
MGHFDVPEMLIGVGIVAFVWLAVHNLALNYHRHHHVRH